MTTVTARPAMETELGGTMRARRRLVHEDSEYYLGTEIVVTRTGTGASGGERDRPRQT